MVWETCNVILHGGSNGIFYTSDIVTGSVILKIKQEAKLRQIDLKVKGTCKAKWSRPSPTMPYIKIYSEKKNIFNVIIDVFTDLKSKTVKPGLINRQFHFILPSDLPSTYKDSVAKVCYKIIIKSKSAYRPTKRKEITFTVLNHINIGQLDEYKVPMIYELSRTFGKSEYFTMNFKTHRGFAAKQLIPFEATITNEKKIKVKKIKVSLVQKLDYNIASGHYSDEKKICKSYFSDILNMTYQTCYFHMEIPQVMPSTYGVNDPVVNISYLLRVEVKFRFHFPLISDIPVIISTVPLNHDGF